jgi:hypothetical protein
VLKLAIPTLTVLVPYGTKYITMFLQKFIKVIPPWGQTLASSLIGVLVGGLAGAIPDFPVGVESGATMGAAIGGASQVIANTHPDALQPNPNVKGPGTAKPEK